MFGAVCGKFYRKGVSFHGRMSEGMSGRGGVVRGACPDPHGGLQESLRHHHYHHHHHIYYIAVMMWATKVNTQTDRQTDRQTDKQTKNTNGDNRRRKRKNYIPVLFLSRFTTSAVRRDEKTLTRFDSAVLFSMT